LTNPLILYKQQLTALATESESNNTGHLFTDLRTGLAGSVPVEAYSIVRRAWGSSPLSA